MEETALTRKIRFTKRKSAVGIIAWSAVLLVCLLLASLWISRDWRQNLYLDPLLLLYVTVAPFLLWHSLTPRSNFLVLYEDGLTLQRGFRGRFWPWQDLSACQIQPVKTFWLYGHRSDVLMFDAPGSDWRSRLLRWYFRLPSRPPAVVIENIYDVPVDEIAAKLNDYRRRALDSGAAEAG